MKAKRRQELKSNDLAQWLEEMSVSFKDWSVYILVGVAVVVVAAVIVTYRQSAKAEAVTRDYTELVSAAALGVRSGERKTNDELAESIAKLGTLAAGAHDDTLKLDALAEKGNLALQVAESATAGIDKAYLEEARAAFRKVLEQYPERTVYCGRALFGLFQIEADLFAVDGDASRKQEAAKYLEKLRDDARFSGTPYQTVASDLLTQLDEIFTEVTFPQRPAPTPSPSPAPPSDTPPIPAPVDSAPADAEGAVPADNAPPDGAAPPDTPLPEEPAGDEAAGTALESTNP